MKVVVVGAGIMGLSTAWSLVRRGHSVSVFEQGAIPNPLGSSVDEHRLIRYPYGTAIGYTRMVADAYLAWEALWADLGERLYEPTGTLALTTGDPGWARDSARSLTELAMAVEWLDAPALARRFPQLDAAPIAWGFHVESGGVLLAEAIVQAVASHLRGRGAMLRPGSRVREVDPARTRLLLETGEVVDADALVVAAGAWVTRLLPGLAARVTPSRQVVAYLEAPAELQEAWSRSPMILDIDPRSGFYVVPPVRGTRLKVGDHRFTLAGDPDSDREPGDAEARALFERLRPVLRDADRYRLAGARTCFYTVEPRERFLVEPLERAWLVSACSGHGFKFGAVIGERVADAIEARRWPAEVTRWAAGEVE
jgi:glycine/D-amino acid oxidase-like deaminating enzyme